MSKKKPTKKLESIQFSMQDIWAASRPNIYKNNKKYNRKDNKGRGSMDPLSYI